MPVDEKQYDEFVKRQQERAQGNGGNTTAPPAVEGADLREYMTENEHYNSIVRHMEPVIKQMLDAQDDAKARMVGALQEPAARAMQIKYWQHKGLEDGIRLVLQQMKDHKLTS